jgi:hypothetical protein
MWEHQPLHELQPPLLGEGERETENQKTLDDYDNPDLLETYQGTAWNGLVLRELM